MLAAVGLALAAAWPLLADHVFFLASVDGTVLSKEIRRVMINRSGERQQESRYTLVIRDTRGRIKDYEVSHDVFIQVVEGSSVHKSPFSSHFTSE